MKKQIILRTVVVKVIAKLCKKFGIGLIQKHTVMTQKTVCLLQVNEVTKV